MSSAQLDTVRADRLAKASTFEWCLSWTDLAPHLDPHRLGLRGEALPPLVGGRVLVPGAGTSELSAQLMSSGCYSEVISLDYDSGCTEHMAAHYRGEKGLEWVTADVCDPVAVAAAVAPGICGLVVCDTRHPPLMECNFDNPAHFLQGQVNTGLHPGRCLARASRGGRMSSRDAPVGGTRRCDCYCVIPPA